MNSEPSRRDSLHIASGGWKQRLAWAAIGCACGMGVLLTVEHGWPWMKAKWLVYRHLSSTNRGDYPIDWHGTPSWYSDFEKCGAAGVSAVCDVVAEGPSEARPWAISALWYLLEKRNEPIDNAVVKGMADRDATKHRASMQTLHLFLRPSRALVKKAQDIAESLEVEGASEAERGR